MFAGAPASAAACRRRVLARFELPPFENMKIHQDSIVRYLYTVSNAAQYWRK
jgi:hypothetical protein